MGQPRQQDPSQGQYSSCLPQASSYFWTYPVSRPSPSPTVVVLLT